MHTHFFSDGSNIDKQIEIDKHVLEKFGWARSNFGRVHDIDLRRWAMEKSSEVNSCSIEEFGQFGIFACSLVRCC